MLDILTDYMELVDRSGVLASEAGTTTGDDEFQASFRDAEDFAQAFADLATRKGDSIVVQGGGGAPVPWTSVSIKEDEWQPGLRGGFIEISFHDGTAKYFTWKQARALAISIGEIEQTARRG